ncbi:MAG TPA: hypothetical protein VHN37_11380, partial [Actinomycetota bacterium]|nr:hypothetical protein [Actinomycetota bacterium]
VDVDYDTPVASREEVVHPGQKLGATVGVSEPVVWTITHEHKPGFIRARIAVTPGRSDRGGCLLPHVELEETGRLYD